jgi:hypothetical protein
MQLMKEGDHWELYIPSELAYGDANRCVHRSYIICTARDTRAEVASSPQVQSSFLNLKCSRSRIKCVRLVLCSVY